MTYDVSDADDKVPSVSEETPTVRSRDLERFLTFVDAVVAIAVTLLVLPLVELTTDMPRGGSSAADLIGDHRGQFYAFLLSFVVIARFWWSHHTIVRDVLVSSRGLVWWTFLWMLTIVVLPFPTALTATTDDQLTTRLLYIGTMTLSSACLTALTWSVDRDRIAWSVPTTICFVAALLITWLVPVSGYFPLLLLFLADPMTAWWRRSHPEAERREGRGR